jgi:hypothetical protein
MKRKLIWTALGVVAAALLLTVASRLRAQRPPGPGTGLVLPNLPGRFVVARTVGENIILLDTATGDLYRATPDDIKKFSDKPRPFSFRPPQEKKDDRDDKKDFKEEKKDDKKDNKKED